MDYPFRTTGWMHNRVQMIVASANELLTRRVEGGKPMHEIEITMKMKTAKAAPTRNNTRLSDSLNQVLADSYALLSLTHLAHWNVEGPGFFALHTAFQTQYEELFIAIDEIAERIRALGAYAIGGLGKFAQTAQMKEFVSPLPQEDYVRMLITANEKLVADAKQARDLAGEANDPESQDLMIGRITLHQKTIWMLQSFLKS